MTPDLINSFFELFSSLFVADHIRHLLKEKQVHGLSIVSVSFFTLWGVWNLYYYPALGQMLSFYGGVALVITNFVYVALLFKFKG